MKSRTSLLLLVLLAGGVSGQVTVGPVTDLPQQNPQQNGEPPGSMSGRVVNTVTGEPVRGAMVSLQNYSPGGNFRSATTDGTGRFTAVNLPPGDYFVQASHPSYQGILGLPGPSQIVTVAAGQETPDVNVRIMPGGSISGKVIDDAGEAVVGCSVYALGPRQGGGTGPFGFRGAATTDDRGEYKLDTLTADRYLVYARCQESLPVERLLGVWRPEQIQPAESWLPVFYPDNPSVEGAQQLTVLPGSELAGIDFRLRATPVTTVSGTISGISPGAPGGQPNILLMPDGAAVDQSLAFGASFDAATARFQVQMVPPGSYRLLVISSPAQAESMAYAIVPVTVGRTHPAPLYVQLRPGLSVNGVVEQLPVGGATGASPAVLNSLQGPGRQAPKSPPLGYLHLVPLSQSSMSTLRQAEVHHDGTFTLQGLTPGRYKVVAQISSPQSVTAESIRFGESEANNGVIELTEVVSGALRVRMGSPTQVSASLANAPASSRADWMVFALPADGPSGSFDQFAMGAGKSGDVAHLQNVSAGRFSFVAVEMTMTGGMQNERLNQLLRGQQEPVEILAGQDQTVSPKFFTSEEIQQLALAYLRGETR